MDTLSAKKYVETKARKLPLYKCMITHDWEETQLANVLVMRKHINGNVTAGAYLVDLLCLGIKDTTYYFNIPEEELVEHFNIYEEDSLKEIDYTLAHNIIFAAHDFAMEFDIHPHKDFATSRYILEEDDDKIPLVEVVVGDDEGKPHLMVHVGNQYPDALAKLKRNAGEGNYNYTLMSDEDIADYKMDEDDDDEDDEDDEDMDYDFDDEDDDSEFDLSLDEIEIGALNCLNVQSVMTEDLLVFKNVKKRTPLEQIIIQTELATRLLPPEILELNDDEEFEWQKEFEEMEDTLGLPNNVTPTQDDEFQKAWSEITALEFKSPGKNKKQLQKNEKQIIGILNNNSSNPLLLSIVYENSALFYSEEIADIAKAHAEKLYTGFPLVQLVLALGALVNHTPDLRFEKIYNEKSVRTALPGYDRYYHHEIIYFWLIKIWVSIERNNLRDAIQYYILVSQFELVASNMMLVLNKLNQALLDYYKTLDLKKSDKEENDDPPVPGKIVPFR